METPRRGSEDLSEGGDGEEMVNFLKEAMGKGADDVLRDIDDPDAFADLLEVVTSALTEKISATPTVNVNTEDKNDEDEDEDDDGPPKLTRHDVDETEEETTSLKEDSKKVTTSSSVEVPSTSEVPSNKDKESSEATAERIRNLLKVKLKPESPKRGKSKQAKSPEKPKEKEKKAKKKSRSRLPNLHLHRNCIERYNRNMTENSDLQPCCVILYDVLRIEPLFPILPKKANVPQNVTSVTLVGRIPESNIDQLHNVERKCRNKYTNIIKSGNSKRRAKRKEKDSEVAKAEKRCETPPKNKRDGSEGRKVQPEADDTEEAPPSPVSPLVVTPSSSPSPKKDKKEMAKVVESIMDKLVQSLTSPKKRSGPGGESIVQKTTKAIAEAETKEVEKEKDHCEEKDQNLQISEPEESLDGSKAPSVKKEKDVEQKKPGKYTLLDLPWAMADEPETINVGKRRRQKCEGKNKKFEKLEKERERKLSEQPRCIKGEEKAVPSKIPLSYRIPRAETVATIAPKNAPQERPELPIPNVPVSHRSSGRKDPPQDAKSDHAPSPLEVKVEWNPSFVFKNERKENSSKARDEIPSTSAKFLHSTAKKNYPREYKSDRHRHPPHSSLKVKIESPSPLVDSDRKEVKKVTPDKPDVDCRDTVEVDLTSEPEDSIGSGGGGNDTLPPISEVEMGNFAVAVTKLMENKTKLLKEDDVPTFNHFTSASDLLQTEKCAWWFASCNDTDLSTSEDNRFPRLENPPSYCGSNVSDISFVGNVSNSDSDDGNDCQVNQISSTSLKYDGARPDPDTIAVDELCGRSLLIAKIRSSVGPEFRNIFELRSGSHYDRENFQAKCNLCRQLIIGKVELAQHVRGETHKRNLREIDSFMENKPSSAVGKNKSEGSDMATDVKVKVEKTEKRGDSETRSNANGDNSKLERIIKTDSSGVKVEYGKTSNGLSIKIPLDGDRGSFNRTTLSKEKDSNSKDVQFLNLLDSDIRKRGRRSRSRSRSRDRERDRRRRSSRSRSPIVRIARSPTESMRQARQKSPVPLRRNKSRSRSKSRSKSPHSKKRKRGSEGHRDRRDSHRSSASPSRSRRRRKSRSKSPPPQLMTLPKKDNREFHEKLALTADGKWTDEMEKHWKLMEAEEAMFRVDFLDRRKLYVSSPEEHPKYAEEWTTFWEKRYQELEKEGRDPDSYDYVAEWKEVWAKRLNFLLQEEAEDKLRTIKQKHGVDFESLSKLRKPTQMSPLFPHPPVLVAQAAPMPVPAPVPAPVPPPGKPQPIVFTIGSGSTKSSGKGAESVVALSSGGGSVASVGGPPKGKTQSISVEDFKSTWEALTRTGTIAPSKTEKKDAVDSKAFNSQSDQDSPFIPEYSVTTPAQIKAQLPIAPEPSVKSTNTTSSSDGGFDFAGFDLVQILRLLCKCEDHLSFLAPKVLEYYKKAEELELRKSKGSLALLENEELVSILFQARDRFMSMIRMNVLGREVLQTMNLTVFGLNCMLDAPQCQKFRPKLPSVLPEVEVPTPQPTTSRIESQQLNPPPPPPPPEPTDEFSQLMSYLSPSMKTSIADEISDYFSVEGEPPNEQELKLFVVNLLKPLLQRTVGIEHLNRRTEPQRVDVEVKETYRHVPEPEPGPTVLSHQYAHSMDMRVNYITGTRVVGTALPMLPNLSFRSIGGMELTTGGGGPGPSLIPPLGSGQQDFRPKELSGRRSPFSRREMAMNPVVDRDQRF